jgi:transposase InsO family protein
MKVEKANFPVIMMARVLEVSASGFYAWLKRSRPVDPWCELRHDIEQLWIDSDKVFGARSIHKLVSNNNHKATLYRIRKCMKELGISGCQPRSSKRTTIVDPRASKRKDLIKRNFESPIPTIKLVGDITYLKTGNGWLYLAVVIDLCTRMVVGWAMAGHMKASLVVSALEMAHTRGYVAKGAIFHSDLGSQYTSHEFSQFADSIDVELSCGRVGSCYDNAVAESWFSSLKNEKYHRYSYATHDEAKNAVVEYIEVFYNRKRPHSSVDGQIPAKKMESFFARTANIITQSNEEAVKYLAA